jgi:hypothetical protein
MKRFRVLYHQEGKGGTPFDVTYAKRDIGSTPRPTFNTLRTRPALVFRAQCTQAWSPCTTIRYTAVGLRRRDPNTPDERGSDRTYSRSLP